MLETSKIENHEMIKEKLLEADHIAIMDESHIVKHVKILLKEKIERNEIKREPLYFTWYKKDKSNILTIPNRKTFFGYTSKEAKELWDGIIQDFQEDHATVEFSVENLYLKRESGTVNLYDWKD